jgi:hypothetical protein
MIDLYPDAETASIRLEGWDAYPRTATLTRTDRNGTHPVRLKKTQDFRGGIAVRDYEPALFGDVTYTLRSGSTVEEVSTSLDGSLSQFAAEDVLTFVARPEHRFIPDLTLSFEPTRESKATVHDIVGRSTPIVIQGPMGSRRGTLEFLALDSEQANAADALQELQGPFLFRFSEGILRDLYLVPVSTSVSLAENYRWRVRIEYVEVAYPTVALDGGTGLRYGELEPRHGTYAHLAADYGSYREILEGE